MCVTLLPVAGSKITVGVAVGSGGVVGWVVGAGAVGAGVVGHGVIGTGVRGIGVGRESCVTLFSAKAGVVAAVSAITIAVLMSSRKMPVARILRPILVCCKDIGFSSGYKNLETVITSYLDRPSGKLP